MLRQNSYKILTMVKIMCKWANERTNSENKTNANKTQIKQEKNVCLLQKPNVQNLNKENIEVIWKNKKNLC